ncbi:MAG TPA: hypothetical protein VM658_21485 [bacterium]|nr:hypothetical protein [bacterium]
MSEKIAHNLRPDRPADHARVLIILLAALVVIFHADLFSGADLFFKAYRDINPITYGYPFLRLDLMSWSLGLFPLWNPYNLLGTPLVAGYQSAVFSPLLWPLTFGPIEALAVPYLFARLALAGWGAYVFGRRLGLSKSAATVAAISFGLTGYLVQYVNDQNIVIDLLIPWLLVAAHRLIKNRRLIDVILMSAASALVILGGQPGAAIFTLALGYGYALFIFFAATPRRMGTLALIAAAAIIASIVSLPQLLPFFEFMPQAWTFHQAGFGAEHLPPSGLITLIAPGFYGPLDQAQKVLPLIRIAPYLGAAPAALALAAALRPRRAPDAFFAAVLAFSLGVLAGLPLFDLIPRLPGLAFLTFIKYIQPLIAFSAAFLAASMTDELRRGQGRLRVAASALILIGAAVAACALIHPELAETARDMNGAVLLLIALAGSAALIALASVKAPGPRGARALSAALIALVVLDLVSASAVNRPFMFRNMAREDFAAIKRMIGKDDAYARFIASDNVMVPNQGLLVPAFEFGLADGLIIRDSVDLFSAVSGLSGDTLYHEFTRYHSLRVPLDALDSPLSRLIGLRHRLTRLPLPANKTIDAIMSRAELAAPSPAHFAKVRMTIADDEREAIFAHPPGAIRLIPDDLGMKSSGAGPVSVSFSAGLDPRVKNLAGDGVWFMALSREMGPSLLWALYIDSRQQPGDRSWKNIELRAQAEIGLTLATLPAASIEHDWAAWGDVRAGDGRRPSDEMANGFRLYKDEPAGPRVFLADAGAPELERPGRGSSAIERYGLQRVSCRAAADGTGLLVLADAYYPGWRALVAGEETRIAKTAHGLRAVPVPEGKSVVEFIYEPVSFRVALWAALACLFVIVFLGAMHGLSLRSPFL